MVNDETQNDNGQQSELVESIPLATLLENPDPDFDVIVEKRSKDHGSQIERARDENRPAPPSPKTANLSVNLTGEPIARPYTYSSPTVGRSKA